MVIKMDRKSQYREIPLRDAAGSRFVFTTNEPIPELLHRIDRGAGGFIKMPEPVLNPATRDQYVVSSLIEEAITSSQLEGATTTRKIAKEMIRTGRPPRDRSEQMIFNNFQAMEEIRRLRDEPLTSEIVFALHKGVAEKTLDDPTGAGRFRRPDEGIDVGDDFGQVFHVPPPADQLQDRLAAMCDFANADTSNPFIHPVLRSIMLHFWLAYDHPFLDGNGRTARALFYWSMLHRGYWLSEFISISELIHKAPAKYGRAFLYTETDENDLTYFLLYHLDLIERAVQELHHHIERKTDDQQRLERSLRAMAALNHRQKALIVHALRHPRQQYTIESHRRSHDVVYQTARQDLLDLAQRGLLLAEKVGREWHFTPVDSLERRLRVAEGTP
jgi:Fic family protein